MGSRLQKTDGVGSLGIFRYEPRILPQGVDGSDPPLIDKNNSAFVVSRVSPGLFRLRTKDPWAGIDDLQLTLALATPELAAVVEKSRTHNADKTWTVDIAVFDHTNAPLDIAVGDGAINVRLALRNSQLVL